MVIVIIVAMGMVVAVLMAMVIMWMRVIVAAAGIAANVFVGHGVFRCRASHFFFPAGLT